MNRLGMFALGILLLAPNCSAHAQMDGYYPKGGPDVGGEDVSLIQLIANPQAFDNKRVRITGFLHLEFEGNVIYLHSDDFLYSLTKNGLWIDVPKEMTQGQIKAVNDQYVICTGRFAANMHGHMGLNSGEMTDITRLEVWSPYPRSIPK
ncbi:hypothetical protein [Acidicapsa acidisoli]|uniref:hypothetical protein n=1 Tax=Acidicapsa acidisoli TaxID=1615681 RepID=UPI0021DF7620|nr:hypothetical protein [Acidicapsa acidisoli]